MSSSVIIRVYEPRDRAAVDECMVELQEVEWELDANRRRGAEIAAPYIQQLLDRRQADAGELFVAEVNGEIAGFVCVYAKLDSGKMCPAYTKYAYVSDIVVRSTHRGGGIGRLLLERAEAFAREKGALVINLDVLSRNVGAVGFYELMGYDRIEISMRKVLAGNPFPPR